MKKQALSVVLAAAMTAAALAGCGSAGSTGSSAAATTAEAAAAATESGSDSTGEKVTLRFAWWGGDERNAATQKVIDQFTAAHPEVTIEAEPGSSDGYHDKLATQLASGTAPDIVQVDPERMPTFVDSGDYFYDLKEYGADTSLFDANYISLQINGNYDGKQLGLPTGIAGPAIIVNKDLADKFGIDLQKKDITWEDWIEYGKKVHEADPETYLFCANKEYLTNLFVYPLAKQYDGAVFDEDGKLVLSQESLTKIFKYIKDLYDNNVIAPASYTASYIADDLQSDANWLAGKYVGALCFISTMDVMAAGYPDGNYVAATLPVIKGVKDGGFASNTPQLLAVTKSCKHPETAAAFLNYFFNDKTAEETLGATRSVPPTEQARKICEENGTLSKVVVDAADIATAIGGTPNDKIASSDEAKTIVYDAVEAVGYGQMTPEDAAADVLDQFSSLAK